MANQAPITPAAQTATFDAALWLSHFEQAGGGFLATESQTSICIAYQGTTTEQQATAKVMVALLTDDQRAAVIAHIRAKVGLSDVQPDLKVVCSQGLSEPAGISPPSRGEALDDQPKGRADMDMTHAFTLPSNAEHPVDWDGALAKYEALYAFANTMPVDHPQMEDAVNAYSQALDHLVKNVPAPNPAAVSWKFSAMRKEWEGFETWPEWAFDAIEGDLQALSIQDANLAVPAVSLNSDLQTKWDAAMARYQGAETAYEPYTDAPAAPDGMYEEISASFRDLMDTPAPDAASLQWKLKELLEDNVDVGCTLADAVRLIGGGRHGCQPQPVASPSGRVEWDAVISAYHAAKEAYERHSRDVHDPAGENMTREIGQENNRLGEILTDCENAMIRAAAPDLWALRTKLDYVFKDDGDGYAASWSLGYLEQTLADIARLLRASQTAERVETGRLDASLDAALAHRSAWDQAYHQYRCLKLRMDAYYALGPMDWANNDHDLARACRATNPEAFEAAQARLTVEEAAQCSYYEPADEAANMLIKMSAPDLEAVAIKIQLHKDHIESCENDRVVWGYIEADLLRLRGADWPMVQLDREAA